MKLFFASLLIFSSLTFAQELNCSVTVNLANLSPSDRPLVSGFDVAVRDYMNKTKFSNADWPNDKITCALTILFLTASSDGNFSAQVIVTSSRQVYQSSRTLQVLRINDGNWQFTYQKGQGFNSNQTSFDPLVSFLDYYANIIIGFNEDSWDENGGTAFFNRAYRICNLANSSTFNKGWSRSGMYSRQALSEDILNDKFQPFREAFYQFYYAIDYIENRKEDTKKAQDILVGVVKTIAGMRNQVDNNSVVLRTFFDASSGEFVNYLRTYPDKSIFNLLKQIDPSHTSQYDSALSFN